MNKKITASIFSLVTGMSFLFAQVAYAATYPNTGGTGQQWVTDPSTTGLYGCYTGFDVTDCTAGGGLTYAAETCGVYPTDVTAVGSTTALDIVTTGDQIAGGGYYYNCIGTDTESPHDNWVCRADTTNVSNHIETQCTGAGASSPHTSTANTDTNCLSGWMNCSVANGGADNDNDTCLEQKNVTDTNSVHAHTHFGATCDSYTCDSGYLSCDGLTTDPADDTTGCETSTSADTEGLTGTGKNVYTNRSTSCANLDCDAGYIEAKNETAENEGCKIVQNVTACTVTTAGATQGLSGVCTGSSGSVEGTFDYVDGTYGQLTGTCECDPSPVDEFATGGTVDADGNYALEPATMSTTNPLIWGRQEGSGDLVELQTSGSQVVFEIDSTGRLTTGFIGDAEVSDNASGITTGYALVWDGTQVVWDEVTASGFTGTVGVDQGGTGITTYTIGDLLYADGTQSITTIGIGTTDQVLTVDGSGAPVWAAAQGDNLGNHTATDNLDLATHKLVGSGGSTGLSISSNGTVSFDGSGVNLVDNSLSFLSTSTLHATTFAIDAPTEDTTYVLPNADGTNGQILSTNGSGVLSWITDTDTTIADGLSCGSGESIAWDGSAWACATNDTDTTIADGQSCTDGQVLTWNNTAGEWRCADDGLIKDYSCTTGQILAWNVSGGNWYCEDNSGGSLDASYNIGRTITVDAGPVELLHSGTENALLVWNGTNTFLTVDSTGQVGVGKSNPEYALDIEGITRSDNFKLIATANGSGVKPTTTCDSTTDGNIEYVVGNDNYGRYYGCKAIPNGDDLYDGNQNGYTWVSMEVFGSLN